MTRVLGFVHATSTPYRDKRSHFDGQKAIAAKPFRLQQLVFSRWAQVMYRFEKGMYENPDQDLNKAYGGIWLRSIK